MQSHPLTQWLALGKVSLAMFKQLGDAASAQLQQASGQLPSSQAQFAQLFKSTLDMSRELNEMQTAACISLLKTQLGTLDSPLSAQTLQNLLEVHFDFMSNLSSQWKTALEKVTERTNTCIGDLRKAQSKDDVSIVMAGFLRDVGEKLRKDAEESAVLINSAAAATSVLTERALDGLAAGTKQQAASE